jgi:hypothetical protein
MSAKHTPGPWDVGLAPVSKTLAVFAGLGETWICGQFRADNETAISFEEAYANALVAAAAPDMLEALKRLVEPAPGVEKLPPWAYGIVMPVLAKAEGRS